MRKVMTVLLGLFFGVALIHGKVFAEENVNATEAAVESLKITEASLASLPEGSVPLDEEIEDEEVVDTDA